MQLRLVRATTRPSLARLRAPTTLLGGFEILETLKNTTRLEEGIPLYNDLQRDTATEKIRQDAGAHMKTLARLATTGEIQSSLARTYSNLTLCRLLLEHAEMGDADTAMVAARDRGRPDELALLTSKASTKEIADTLDFFREGNRPAQLAAVKYAVVQQVVDFSRGVSKNEASRSRYILFVTQAAERLLAVRAGPRDTYKVISEIYEDERLDGDIRGDIAAQMAMDAGTAMRAIDFEYLEDAAEARGDSSRAMYFYEARKEIYRSPAEPDDAARAYSPRGTGIHEGQE